MNHRIHNTPSLPLRSRARRAVAAIVGLGALAAAAPAGAVPSSRVALYTNDGKDQPGLFLDDFVCSVGDSHARNESEMQPLVSQTPLPEIVVSYVSDGMTTEADVFALDPTILSMMLRNQAFTGVVYDPYGGDWEKMTRRPSDSQNVSLPFAVVVPYPNQDVLFLPPPGSPPLDAQVILGITKFAGNPPNALAGLAADPGLGSVKALRVYDHGFCSHPEDLQPIYKTISENIWDGFEDYAHSEGADAKRFYTAIVTMLDHENKAPSNDLHGGFQLSGHLAAYPDWPAPDIDASAFMEAELVLDNGHLRAEYVQKPFVIPDVAANPWISDDDVIALVSGMFDEVKDSIGEKADAAQTINVLGGSEANLCDPGVDDPCHDARLTFGGLVKQAAAWMGFTYQISVDPDQLQKAVMKEDLWSCVLTAPGSGPQDDCDPDVDPQCIHDKPNTKPDPEDPVIPPRYECRFFVPAKRLNVYPDQVELVWFDELTESTNPAVGLFAAAYASGNKKALEDLCAPRPDNTSVDFRQREYARDFSGTWYSPAP